MRANAKLDLLLTQHEVSKLVQVVPHDGFVLINEIAVLGDFQKAQEMLSLEILCKFEIVLIKSVLSDEHYALEHMSRIDLPSHRFELRNGGVCQIRQEVLTEY